MTDKSIPAVEDGEVFTANDTFIKTLVSSNLYSRIIEKSEARLLNVLVGFKYFGQISAYSVNQVLEKEGISRLQFSKLSFKERIELYIKHGVSRFIHGGEESMGMNRGDYVYDKDTPATMAFFSEIVGHLGLVGKTPVDHMDELYIKHGLHKEEVVSFRFEGATGDTQKKELMKMLRSLPLQEINNLGLLGGKKVVGRVDYKIKDVNGNKVERFVESLDGFTHYGTVGLPITYSNHAHNINFFVPSFHVSFDKKTEIPLESSDYVVFYLENGSEIHIRPSGTEPIVKFYLNLVPRGIQLTSYYNEEKVSEEQKVLKMYFEEITDSLKKFIENFKNNIGMATTDTIHTPAVNTAA